MRSWAMHAGWAEHPDRGRELRNFGSPRYVRMYGREPVQVRVTEDPDGSYFGWLITGGELPVMIQPDEFLFRVQFPYGPEESTATGRGEVLRLSAEAIG